ncbi:factor of DNA methylation 5-like [Salvia miltiorrhiza]|uniref:factor of DNA methylation 5-like n=1 Tax=Salvia miltiorrhiza TaxID=226208 RepID=UPI0025AD04F8|nr:factor of DNA methylation 5-like [Salvia miltiorrhiza]
MGSSRVDVEMGNSSREEFEDLNDDSQMNEYKQLSYKLFHFQTYRLFRGSNGEFGCPFCSYKECRYTHLLLHAVQVAEGHEPGKKRANHYAMARYLAIDLAHQLKAEADQLSWSSEDGKLMTKGEIDKVRLHHLERKVNELIAKVRQSSDELQGVRTELIKGLNDIPRGNNDEIGIRFIQEIDTKVLVTEMEKKGLSSISAAEKGDELRLVWQEILKNSEWYPYQIIQDANGKRKIVLKEDDPSLKDLKKRWCQEIHDAVVEALNASELWNLKENRKAKLDEVISYILEALRVRDVSKMGATSGTNTSRIKEHSEINNSHEEFDIAEHKDKTYKLLKSCTYQVRGPCGQLRCPFCSVEEDRNYSHLLRHAFMVAEDSSESAEQRATHLALLKYLVIDLQHNAAEPPPQSTRPAPSGEDDLEIVEETRQVDTKRKRQRVGDDTNALQLKNLLKQIQDSHFSYQNLAAREQKSNAKLKGAWNEVIKGLNDIQIGNNAGIGVKQIGELDVDVFKRACGDTKGGVELCSTWQEKLKDPQWRPFWNIEDDTGNLKEVVDEEDETLRGLKHDWGDEVYNAIVTALKELHEYSPGRCNTGAQIWNLKENRKAELDQVIRYVFTQLMPQNRKRRASTRARRGTMKDDDNWEVEKVKKVVKRRLGRYQNPKPLSMEMISQYFGMPIAQASAKLGIGRQRLNRRCRELKIPRWPHTKKLGLEIRNKNVPNSGSGSGSNSNSDSDSDDHIPLSRKYALKK